MTGWQTKTLLIPADHPSAAGHFPGNPVVPGALLLDAMLEAMGVTGGTTIRSAKFLRPISPGSVLEFRWQPAGECLMRFACLSANETILTGTVALT